MKKENPEIEIIISIIDDPLIEKDAIHRIKELREWERKEKEITLSSCP